MGSFQLARCFKAQSARRQCHKIQPPAVPDLSKRSLFQEQTHREDQWHDLDFQNTDLEL